MLSSLDKNGKKDGMVSSLTLQNFHAFHGMLCSPRVAKECIQCFHQGTILFLPFNYEEIAVMEENRYTYNHSLTVFTYYLLVLLSFTGLSSILGQTQTMDAREFNHNNKQCHAKDCQSSHQQESNVVLWSANGEPSIQVKPFIFDKLKQQHSSVYHTNRGQPQPQQNNNISLKLKRRFEYQFSLCQLHVIMLHIESCSSTSKEEEENKLLHLVEVYHFQNPLFQTILDTLLYCIGRPVEFLLQKLQPTTNNNNNKQKMN